MSLLLDALNKADQERKRGGENPNIGSNHDAQVTHANTKPFNVTILVIAGIVLTFLLIAVYWLGQKNQQAPTEKNNATTNISTATPVQKRAPIALNDSTIKHTNDAASNTDNNPNNEQNEQTISPSIKNATELADDESIASLYQHQANNTVPIPNSTPIETESNQQTITNPAVPAASPMSITQFANIPDIQDLPSSVLQRIPSLKYSEHNYNNNGGNVVINGVIKHVNDQLSDGLVIDKILEDGMILHFENYSFKMRAMNTWLNM